MNIEEYEEKFSKLLKAMGEMYDKSFSGIIYEMWFNDIKRFEYESVKKAFSIHRQSPDNGKFMPKPGDIIRIIEGTSLDNAQNAWSKVKKSITTIGSYQTIIFDDPIIHRVIQDMGGWINLCQTDEKEMPFKANEFRNRYSSYRSSGTIPEYPKKLYGISESENTTKGQLEHIEKPFYVGDKNNAVLVEKNGINRKSLQISQDNGLQKIALKPIK